MLLQDGKIKESLYIVKDDSQELTALNTLHFEWPCKTWKRFSKSQSLETLPAWDGKHLLTVM